MAKAELAPSAEMTARARGCPCASRTRPCSSVVVTEASCGAGLGAEAIWAKEAGGKTSPASNTSTATRRSVIRRFKSYSALTSYALGRRHGEIDVLRDGL